MAQKPINSTISAPYAIAITLIRTAKSKKIYGYSLKERLSDLWRPFVNTLVMALSVYAVTAIGLGIGLTIIIQLMIGVFVYIAMASITKDDSLQYCINTLREIIHK